MRNKVVYAGWTFTDSDAANGSLAKSQDLTSASLSADSISVEVRCPDPAITQFTLNAPMTYFYRERQKGTYYLQSVTRVSPNHYALSGLSALGLLASMPHLGGLYTGQTVQEIVEEICGTVPVLVKTCLADIRLYGWLPAANPPQKSAVCRRNPIMFINIKLCQRTDINFKLVFRIQLISQCIIQAVDSFYYKDIILFQFLCRSIVLSFSRLKIKSRKHHFFPLQKICHIPIK